MVQRRTRGAERCSAPSSTCRRWRLAACQSAPAQAALLAWARRPRRLTPLPCPFHGVFGSGLRLDVLGEELIVGVECRGLCDGLAELGVAACTQAMPCSCPRLVLVAGVRDCASCPIGRRLAPPCLVHGQAFEGAIEDGAGKSGAPLCLDAALEAAEDGHVAGLQVGRASWRDEAQHDVWESGLHGGQGWPRWRGCWPCPREGSTTVLLCLGSSRRPDWPRAAGSWSSWAQPFSDVTWRVCSGQGCSGKTASVLPACTICTSMSNAPRSMLKATVNVVASFALPCSWACLTPRRPPPDLLQREEAARSLVSTA